MYIVNTEKWNYILEMLNNEKFYEISASFEKIYFL